MLDRLLHGSAFWGWRIGASLAQRLPSWITYPAAVVGGELAYLFWVGRRRVAKQNFAVVLALPAGDREVARVARRSFRNFAKYLAEVVKKAPGATDDIVAILRDREVDVVVSYLPVGSEEATKWYVEQTLEAGCAFINCIPVFIAREPYWQKRFAQKNLPIIGDDIKSQVGATITHRVLTRLFMDRGVRLDRTYQLNFGGNTDFLNMLERERLESKKISKTNAVTSMLDYPMEAKDVHVGPSDYVPWLLDRKWCYIRMEGTTFGDVPLNAEVKLEVWDSPNSAGVVIDAIRCCKLALDRGLGGTIVAPSAYFMKSPPRQIPDDRAREGVEEYIKGRSGQQTLSGSTT